MAPFCPQRDLALHSHGEDVISPLGCANSSEPRTEFSDRRRRRRRNVDTLPPTTSTACNPNEEKYFTFPMTMDSIWRRYGGTGRWEESVPMRTQKEVSKNRPHYSFLLHKLISPYSEKLVESKLLTTF